jgi:CelD/BcsL family acetyltransferase involved in cellulose biosynthesis
MKVERITSYTRFVETEKDWNSLLSRSSQNKPFLSHQWFDAWWKSFGKESELEILFFWGKTDSLVGIAPLMVSGEALRFMASHEVTDYCDFISDSDSSKEFYSQLWDHLLAETSRYSFAELINIPEGSPTLSSLEGLSVGRDRKFEVCESEVVPVLSLPRSYNRYLQKLDRKNRHELRRKTRKWDSLADVRIERITDSEKQGYAIKEFVSLHKTSSPAKQQFWQKKGMDEFFDELVHLFSRENWSELLALYVEDRLIAALLSFSYELSVYFYNIAYDREYSAYSPGFYLFDHAIKQAIAEGKIIADFLRGREKYKYFFGAEESKIYSLKWVQREN